MIMLHELKVAVWCNQTIQVNRKALKMFFPFFLLSAMLIEHLHSPRPIPEAGYTARNRRGKASGLLEVTCEWQADKSGKRNN